MWGLVKTETNWQMLMRVIRFFLLFFPPWIVASADIFSFPWGGFLSQETMHFNLVRRGIILSKFEFYFCKEFVPFLHHICYSEAENVCLSPHLEGIHILLSLYHQFYRCLPVFMPLVCLLPLTLDAFLWFYCVNKGFGFQGLSLPCFLPLQLCFFFPFPCFFRLLQTPLIYYFNCTIATNHIQYETR